MAGTCSRAPARPGPPRRGRRGGEGSGAVGADTSVRARAGGFGAPAQFGVAGGIMDGPMSNVFSIDTPIRVSEWFLSIQGEGPSAGMPAHFLRLQGCSVGCQWCDSKFTWNPEKGKEVSLRGLADELAKLGKAEMIVLTGGEPLEHPHFLAVVEWACSRWKRVEIETSGIGRPPPLPANATYNWSPKLRTVTERADATWQYAAQFLGHDQFICKVVVDSQLDWGDLLLRVERAQIPAHKVVVMPQGISTTELAERGKWLAPVCIQAGYRLSPRMQVEIWGAKRGV